MILLFGGTSETAPIARRLADQGCPVLVSTATDVPLFIGRHPLIKHRQGRLNAGQAERLIKKRQINLVVHACHPYAVAARQTSQEAAAAACVPWLLFLRPPIAEAQGQGRRSGKDLPIIRATDHRQAAELAFALEKPVFLTTGSRNLAPYMGLAKKSGLACFARVLDAPESLEACRAAGLVKEKIIVGRGPFSVEENLRHLKICQAGVLVSKDSGVKGGVPEKIAAARQFGCAVVLIDRQKIDDLAETRQAKRFCDYGSLCEEAAKICKQSHAR